MSVEDTDSISEAIVKKEENEDNILSESGGIELNSKKRLVIFISLVLINLIISLDGGIVSQQLPVITVDFDNIGARAAFYSSIPSIGRGVGGMII